MLFDEKMKIILQFYLWFDVIVWHMSALNVIISVTSSVFIRS